MIILSVQFINFSFFFFSHFFLFVKNRPDRRKRPSTKPTGNITESAKRKKKNKRHLYSEVIDQREFEKYRGKRQISDTIAYNSSETNGNGLLTNMNVSDDHKPDEKHDPKKASKNTVLKAVVYAREIIIPNLGHFEDYNIEVSWVL